MPAAAKSTTESAPAKRQFISSCTTEMITCEIMISRRPPSSAGVMKNPSAVMPRDVLRDLAAHDIDDLRHAGA